MDDNFLLSPQIVLKFQDKQLVFVWTNIGSLTDEEIEDGAEVVVGYKDFDYWTDARRHMKDVHESKLFPENVNYYLYIPPRKLIYQIDLTNLKEYDTIVS